MNLGQQRDHSEGVGGVNPHFVMIGTEVPGNRPGVRRFVKPGFIKADREGLYGRPTVSHL